MKRLWAIGFCLLLGACQTDKEILREEHWKVVTPPDALYKCDFVKKLPNADTLTDVEVARLIDRLYHDNKTCKLSISAIRTYLERAKKEIEN